jgi:hypothetical protein
MSNGAGIGAAGGSGRPTFGVDLAEQMTRDDVEVPPIVRKCCDAIEKYGIESQGIYRISGTTSKIQALKQLLDKGTFLYSCLCPVYPLGRRFSECWAIAVFPIY